MSKPNRNSQNRLVFAKMADLLGIPDLDNCSLYRPGL